MLLRLTPVAALSLILLFSYISFSLSLLLKRDSTDYPLDEIRRSDTHGIHINCSYVLIFLLTIV